MKKPFNRTIPLLTALITALYLFSGACAFADAWDLREKKDNILRYALHTSRMGSLDPDHEKGSQDRVYADMVFNSLWRYVPGDAGHIEPDLALDIPKFRLEDGHQIWTIRLRHNVYFHQSPYCRSHELTSRDVVYSLKKACDPERSASAGYFTPMAFNIIDSHTLEISLDKSISSLFFLTRLSNWHGGHILSRQAIEEGGYDNFCRHPVGTGPFQFESYKQGEKLVLKANQNYFRGQPKLDGVEIYFMPKTKDREEAFRSGKLDVIYGTGLPGWIEKIKKEPGCIVDILGPGFTGMFHFNTAKPPLDNILVRRALVTGLNREAFLSATSRQLTTPCLAPMSPAFLPGGLKNDQVRQLAMAPEYNPHAAVAMLTQAGYPNGFDLDVVVSEKRLYKENFSVLKSLLEQIHVRLNMTMVPHARYHQMIRKDVNPIVLYFSFRPNADIYLRGFFHSNSIVVTGKTPQTNFSHYAGIDTLLDDALGAIAPSRQIAMWQQAQIKLLDDMVVFPLFDINQMYVRKEYVDYHHPLYTSLCDYPQFTEETRLVAVKPVPSR